jgi:tRNA (cmo5U34)-methyltransferase
MTEPAWSHWQLPASVEEYLRFGDDGMPGRREQLAIMIQSIPFDRRTPITLLDLGCGDGVLLDTVLGAFPNAAGAVGLDASPAMLERASVRLATKADRVRFVTADMGRRDWRRELSSTSRFDVVVSGFAIHHLEDDRKQELFGEVFELTASPGVFVNIEHVRSASPRGEQLFERWYSAHLAARAEREEGVTAAEVERAFRERPGKRANRLAPVEDQLRWLRACGFEEVDCYWKHFELAVIVGYRA